MKIDDLYLLWAESYQGPFIDGCACMVVASDVDPLYSYIADMTDAELEDGPFVVRNLDDVLKLM